MDPRLTPFSGRVAHVSLRGRVAADHYTAGDPARIRQLLVDLERHPGGPRDRQLLWGDRVLVIDRRDSHAHVMADKDGYCGWVDAAAIGPDHPATHRVAAPFSQLYAAPKVTTREVATLPFAAQLAVSGTVGRFAETPDGFVPLDHLRPLGDHDRDPVAVAAGFLGTPYLWGGNSRAGIDCSGLVQAALLACGVACPGDSDLQAGLGRELAADEASAPGDLILWQGHVAMVSGPDEIIHATAAFMAVVREPLGAAIARIMAAENRPVTHRRRWR